MSFTRNYRNLFQSAPRILMRGDIVAGTGISINTTVSIRAPHSHAGRPSLGPHVLTCASFQSAPRILMRGDRDDRKLGHGLVCFNPRPAFSCGATATAVNYAATTTYYATSANLTISADYSKGKYREIARCF